MKKLLKIDGSCAVVALAHASGVDEETVLRVCTSCGFEAGSGMDDDDWQEAANCLGLTLKQVRMKPMALYSFIKKYQDGLYLVGTVDHLFVVDNGIIFDPRNPTPPGLRRSIKQAWRVV
jgi:hypothetical protein